VLKQKGHVAIRCHWDMIQEWAEAAKTRAKFFTNAHSAPLVMMQNQENFRVVNFPGSHSTRHMPGYWMHATLVRTGALTNSRAVDWTGFAANPGMQAYGTRYMPARLCLTDKNGVRFRNEMHPDSFMILLAWYTKPGDIFCDVFAGTLPSAMACLRTGRYGIFIDNEKDPDMLKKAWRRLEQYYKVLVAFELLPVMGEEPAPPTRWELKGIPWQTRWMEFLLPQIKGVSRKHMNEEKRNKAKLSFFTASQEILAAAHKAISAGKLPSGQRETN
jgi:hypothetical protein